MERRNASSSGQRPMPVARTAGAHASGKPSFKSRSAMPFGLRSPSAIISPEAHRISRKQTGLSPARPLGVPQTGRQSWLAASASTMLPIGASRRRLLNIGTATAMLPLRPRAIADKGRLACSVMRAPLRRHATDAGKRGPAGRCCAQPGHPAQPLLCSPLRRLRATNQSCAPLKSSKVTASVTA